MDARTAQSLSEFAEGAGPELRGFGAEAVFEQLDQQYGDLQLAVQWFIEQGHANEAFRLASSLVAFWMATKRLEEARRLCREALAVTDGTADQAGRSSAMHVLGVTAQMAGDLLEARELMGQRIALAREMGNLATVSIEAGNLSMVERQLRNLEEAEALAREALDIDYRRGDNLAIPWKVNGLAAVETDRGEFDRAATLIGVADATMEAAGGSWPPDELAHYERTVATLTDTMGSAAFERARAGGYSRSNREAVDFALAIRSAE